MAFWEAIDKLKEQDIGTTKKDSDTTQIAVIDMMFNQGMDINDILRKYGIIEESKVTPTKSETKKMFDMGEEQEIEEEGYDIYETTPL